MTSAMTGRGPGGIVSAPPRPRYVLGLVALKAQHTLPTYLEAIRTDSPTGMCSKWRVRYKLYEDHGL
jgi:hypothetical protein